MKSIEKFTDKALNYKKFRPSYPKELFSYLIAENIISSESCTADIGAGTGIFTALTAPHVMEIIAVEPNAKMMESCAEHCRNLTNVKYMQQSAENTKIEKSSIDTITCAQAFHWFDREKVKTEFKRILKPEGHAVLVWNSRVPDSDVSKKSSELFTSICPEFKGFSGGAGTLPEEYNDFFRNGKCAYTSFSNYRFETLESFIGSSLSASYAPQENNPKYKDFILGLTEIFNSLSINEVLTIPNLTHCFAGKL